MLYALHDLNCVVGSKEKIGIVGRTRAGKSSLKTYRKNELQGEGYYEQGRSTLIFLAKNRDQFSIADALAEFRCSPIVKKLKI